MLQVKPHPSHAMSPKTLTASQLSLKCSLARLRQSVVTVSLAKSRGRDKISLKLEHFPAAGSHRAVTSNRGGQFPLLFLHSNAHKPSLACWGGKELSFAFYAIGREGCLKKSFACSVVFQLCFHFRFDHSGTKMPHQLTLLLYT